MRKFLKIFFSILLFIILIVVVFCVVDYFRVYDGREPIFTFEQKLLCGENATAKVDVGFGYKIMRVDVEGQEEKIKLGTIFMDESLPIIDDNINEVDKIENVSGESGENEIIKVTTFGEKYKDTVFIEGLEEVVDAKRINSKIGYSMNYYYELFDYTGFEDHDLYTWYLSSGDNKATMTIYNISDEEKYKDSLEEIEKDKTFEELSGDTTFGVSKSYYKFTDDDYANYIYILELENLKLKVDFYYKQEAAEGIGAYMSKMLSSVE